MGLNLIYCQSNDYNIEILSRFKLMDFFCCQKFEPIVPYFSYCIFFLISEYDISEDYLHSQYLVSASLFKELRSRLYVSVKQQVVLH